MKRKFILVAALCMALSAQNVYAEEITEVAPDNSQEQVVQEDIVEETPVETQVEVQSNDEDEDEEIEELPSLADSPSDDALTNDGYEIEVTDEKIDSETWQYECDETITITGESDEVTFSPAATEYNVMPGDGGKVIITIKNGSDKKYIFVDTEHYDSTIRNFCDDTFSADRICSYMKGTSRAAASPVTEWIEKNIVGGEYNPNSRKFRNYINEENLLKAYNSLNETSFDSLEDAWQYNFFKNCWTLIYSKNWEDLDYTNGDQLEISWNTDGFWTDNAYQNCVWSWGDIITIAKEEVVIPEPDPIITPEPEPIDEEETEEVVVEKTSLDPTIPETADTNGLLFYTFIALCALTGIIFCRKKFK